ncbi:MAG: sugar phosphate isomerase/epimerase [Streptomycetaceae bacterium]|nr:sugar phosphate isomerase/epimerase [Streptomycetaceae bacterium]
MTHPRLSVSAMCTYPWSFAEDLALWEELGIRRAGLILAKLEAHGLRDALAALAKRGIAGTTIITHNFDLSAPDTWDATRAIIKRAVDVAADVGGTPYFTPGAGDGRPADALAAALARAVEPCVAYADARGVRLAIEPTLRRERSFVHTLGDGAEVAWQAGVSAVADLGNCWMEPGLDEVVRRVGPRIAVAQFADARTGAGGEASPGRAVPGDGDLDIGRFIRAVLATGYTGAFELELVGPRIEAEGHASATRRGVARANTLLDTVLPREGALP